MEKLFQKSLSQLVDYSSLRVAAGTRTGLLPIAAADQDTAATAEYSSEHLVLSLESSESLHKIFRQVERKDLQQLLSELELQFSGLADESQAPRIGALMGAELLTLGKLYLKEERYKLFLKLLRVENSEILSLTRAILDKRLGL